MIDLYYWPTPNGHKITLMLEELAEAGAGLEYAIRPVNIGQGDQFRAEFLEISPNNKMPAIVDHAPADGGAPLSVFESGAILLYLAEKTGRFLPGDLREKILPYLRPLYDAMHDMIDAEDVARLTEKGIIEIAPLAYMRGRTLPHAFIILDEAQNTTSEQMMMFLTRLGEESRMVVTGDVTQVDLPRSKQSGLLEVGRILRDIPGIEFHHFSGADVVRHPLVQKIIDAYARYQNPMNTESAPGLG